MLFVIVAPIVAVLLLVGAGLVLGILDAGPAPKRPPRKATKRKRS